ncbi:hypothetical protein PM082_014281 [Marasmius tenuissimus]|nr:hypothetical protein PM082_014281 [Marasmius tenuissimus]
MLEQFHERVQGNAVMEAAGVRGLYRAGEERMNAKPEQSTPFSIGVPEFRDTAIRCSSLQPLSMLPLVREGRVLVMESLVETMEAGVQLG